GRTPFKDVATRIKDKLATERADTQARTRADEVRPQLQAAKDFLEEARKLGLDPREMAVGRNEPLVGVGRDPQLDETIFSLATSGVSPAVKAPGGYVIVKGVQQLPAGVPPLAGIRERVIDAIKRERAETMGVDRAKALAASLAKGGDFFAAAKADGFATGETPLFSQADPPKERNLPGTVTAMALQTPVGQISEPIRAGATVYLVKTLERVPAAPEASPKKPNEIDKQLLNQKRPQAGDSWIQSKRLAAKIETNAPAPSAVR